MQVAGGKAGEQGGKGAQAASDSVEVRGEEAAKAAEAAGPEEEGGQEGIDAGASLLCGLGRR